MKQNYHLSIETLRMFENAKNEEERIIMINVCKLAVRNEMEGLEFYLNKQWNCINNLLEESERMPQVIRYHAQLDVLAEMYCHFCCDGFDDGFDNLSDVIDDLANKQIKKIQKEMTIHRLWLFD